MTIGETIYSQEVFLYGSPTLGPGLRPPSGRLATALQLSEEQTRVWWQQMFGWLEEFRSAVKTGSQLWERLVRAEEHVRSVGIGVTSAQAFRAALPALAGTEERGQHVAEQIEEFLNAQGQKVPVGRVLLGVRK